MDAAHPLQGVPHPLALGRQLLLIGHVAVLAPPAPPAVRAVRLLPDGGGGDQACPFLPVLPPDSPGNEDHPAVQTGYPHSFRGIALDMEGMHCVFSDLGHGIPSLQNRFSYHIMAGWSRKAHFASGRQREQERRPKGRRSA